ncbi:MAG: glutaconyl-CoA/methylmalonyl-CoA decarboxylase subunit gamma [Petrotoga sp.]|nr:glutaconyl-CoA/methylmalonyl-CoA decarboxylase subunit gamma [Petrotoga sp.]
MKRKFKVTINNKTYEVEVEEIGSETINKEKIKETEERTSEGEQFSEAPKAVSDKKTRKRAQKKLEKKQKDEDKKVPEESTRRETVSGYEVKAPLPGVINEINVKEGQNVKAGDKLVIIEAMKMENEIPAESDGVVEKILVKRGDSVEGDQTLMIIR